MQKKLSFRVDVIVEADSDALVKDAADSLIGKIPHVIKDNQYDNYAAVVRDAYLLGEIAHSSGHEQYGARDAMELDMQGLYYCRHVHAMTREGLVAKSDIAAELGYRDWQIDDLNHALTIALNSVEEISHLAVSAIRGEKSPEELLQRVAITFERNVELLKSLKPSFAMEMTYPNEMMVDGKIVAPLETVAKYETEEEFIQECERVADADTFTEYVRTTPNTNNMG